MLGSHHTKNQTSLCNASTQAAQARKQNQEAPRATQNQLRSTQGYARRTSTGQHTKEVLTFPLERRSRWAEPGLKGETERRGGSSPYSSSRLGIWESPHLSLDLGESPHPVS